MKCKRKIMVGIAFVAVVLCILFQSNTFGRKKSELIIEEVDLKNNCIYATAKNQLYDTDDNYITRVHHDRLGLRLQVGLLRPCRTSPPPRQPNPRQRRCMPFSATCFRAWPSVSACTRRCASPWAPPSG